MDTIALSLWQAGLPADRIALVVMLDALQGEWIAAQRALMPAMRTGVAHRVRGQILELEHQLQLIEGQLTCEGRLLPG